MPAVLAALLAALRPAPLLRADNLVYDTLTRSIAARPSTGRVVIVDIDERSLALVGQWPWSRDVLGQLVAGLRDLGAAVVALDFVFPEADRHEGPPAPVHGPWADVPTTTDDAFAHSLRGGRVLLGYAMTFEPNGKSGRRCVLHPIGLALVQSGPDDGEPPFFRATAAVCSLPDLAEAAAASGFLNAAPDNDGILRRVPLVIEYAGRMYPAIALAAVTAVTGGRDMTLRTQPSSGSALTVDDRSVPLDGRGNLLLRYRGGKRSFPYVSAADVLSGTLSSSALKDKIVFVGTTALGTREVVATPLDTLFAGVEVHATVADNLLQQDFMSRPPNVTSIEIAETLFCGLVITAVVASAGLTWGAAASVLGAALLWTVSLWQLSSAGRFTSPLTPLLGLGAALSVMTVARLTAERARAENAGRDKTTAQALMVQTLLSLTETRDGETGRHSRRTQRYAKLLAQQLSTDPGFRDYLTTERIELISSLAPLHDIGKVGIPDHILNKPGPLTPDELALMRKHPELGHEVILKAEQQVGVRDDVVLAMAKEIVYTHHERWDGSGYPRGLRGEEIPLPGRLMALVDVYDAAVTRTFYQPSKSHEDAVAFIFDRKGSHFDPAVVDAFMRVAPALRQISLGAEV